VKGNFKPLNGVVEAKEPEELPVVTSFGMHKKGAKWVAFAVETQGLKVLRSVVVQADASKDHIRNVMDRAIFELLQFGQSPFPVEGT
jgi:hypothetical protein